MYEKMGVIKSGDLLRTACVPFQINKAKICSGFAVSCGRLSYVATQLTAACRLRRGEERRGEERIA
jgi:hypothetical protein